MKMLLTITLFLMACPLFAGDLQGGGGPRRISWQEIQNNKSLKAQMPSIAFTVETQSDGSRTIFRDIDKLCRFIDSNGQEMIYGGTQKVCTYYDREGYSGRKECLDYQMKELVRPRSFEKEVCLPNGSSSRCDWPQVKKEQLQLDYEIKVYRFWPGVKIDYQSRPKYIKQWVIPWCAGSHPQLTEV